MKKGKGIMNDFMMQSNRLGIFFVIWFAICFAWFYVNPVEQYLYMQMFNLNFFYFSGMNFISFISGAIQSYIWAYIAAGTWIVATKISGMFK